MSFDAETLYQLLPAHLRVRDAEIAAQTGLAGQPGPLESLVRILAEQVAVLEENLDQLYDDHFIETCAEWAVPYLGDLVGARNLIVWDSAPFSLRAQVANTLAYRRRKGAAAVLEQLARDVTGWNANVVEYFLLLVTTQYMNHIRPGNLGTPSLRDTATLETVETPFERPRRTLDVRNIVPRRGRHNIPHIGVFLWRIGNHPCTGSDIFRLDERRFLFHPLGLDTPLYNNPVTEDEITRLATPLNVPHAIKRRVLHRSLADYYGRDFQGRLQSVLLEADGAEIDRDLVTVCDLSDIKDQDGNVIGWAHAPQEKIGIDPELGRIAFPSDQAAPGTVRATWHYGFATEMGGGEYGRSATFTTDLPATIRVPSEQPSIQAALDVLTDGGVVEIETNTYLFETPVLDLGARRIEIRAADERRPILVLSGPLEVTGQEGASLSLNGLLIAGGSIHVPAADNALGRLSLRHCTLAPGALPAIRTVPAQAAGPRLVVETANTLVSVEDSILAPVRAVDTARVVLRNCLLDATSEAEIAYEGTVEDGPGAPLEIVNSTVIGKLHTLAMVLASNTIFLSRLREADAWPAPLRVVRLQQGCVRFSFVPPGSVVPRCFHCQPETPKDAARVRPVFKSLRYADPDYAQLDDRCAREIREGADDGSEMGVFHNLFQPQRETNLRTRLDEYLRFGMAAGIFHAS